MPELPEVETIRRFLSRKILNKKISAIIVNDSRVIKEPALRQFKKSLKGARIQNILRRAKVLVFELDSGMYLVMHLRIAGWLLYGKKEKKARVSFKFSDNFYLNYMDQRVLGEMRLRQDYRDLSFIKKLAPEPFAMDAQQFKDALAGKKTTIKNLLMNQEVISGIGNIYAQEALFLSKIKPQRLAGSLSLAETRLLHKNLISVLKEAIRHKGSSVDTYRDPQGNKGTMAKHLRVYDRKGEPCYVCKEPIVKISLAGRGTCFCPQCQK